MGRLYYATIVLVPALVCAVAHGAMQQVPTYQVSFPSNASYHAIAPTSDTAYEALLDLDAGVSNVQDQATANAASIASNAANIASNAANIATNAADIAANAANIATNAANIATNAAGIAANASAISVLQGDSDLPKGWIQGLNPEYGSGSAITVAPGEAYVRGYGVGVSHATNLTVSMSSVADWHYIYLSTNAAVTVETAVPSYNTTHLGWYQNTRRCVGAVFEGAGAGLPWFSTAGNQGLVKYMLAYPSKGADTNFYSNMAMNLVADNTYRGMNVATLSTMAPVNVRAVDLLVNNNDVTDDVGISIATSSSGGYVGLSRTNASEWAEVATGSGYDDVRLTLSVPVTGCYDVVYAAGEADDTDSLDVYLDGWEIER